MKTVGPIVAALAALTVLAANTVAAPAWAQSTAPDAVAPKVSVVVVGDADARMRAAAIRVEDALVAGGALRVAEDAGLRAALRGEAGPAEDDGLASVRRVRRSLGLGEALDAPGLARLGRMAGAALVVVVRADGRGGVELVTLQVAAAQFYEGALDAEQSALERIAESVGRRARHATRAAATSAASEQRPAGETGRTPSSTSASRETLAPAARLRPAPPAATAPDGPHDEKSFLEKSWPYFVAGALLAGFVTYLVIDSTSGNEPAQTPVLRFSPGP